MTVTPTSSHFTTKNLPPEQRLTVLHEIVGHNVRRAVSPLSDETSAVDITVHRLGHADSGFAAAVSVQQARLTGGFAARRTPELLSDGNDEISLHIQRRGRRIISQRGRQVSIEPGSTALSSNSDSSSIVVPRSARLICVSLPRKPMMALTPNLEDILVRPLPPNGGVVRLLMHYIDALDDGDASATPDLERTAATHIHDLCALMIGASRDAAEIAKGRGLRAARLRAIKADIADNLCQGDVSAAALAMRQGVTERYIHKLFEGEGTTLSRFVLNLRLARVHRLLSDPHHGHLTIGALVYDTGFGDLSTFNRAFRQHFGMTPSDVRAARK